MWTVGGEGCACKDVAHRQHRPRIRAGGHAGGHGPAAPTGRPHSESPDPSSHPSRAKSLRAGDSTHGCLPSGAQADALDVQFGAAERLGMVPRGTHDWNDFVTPEELEELLSAAGLTVGRMDGVAFSPSKGLHLSDDTSLNYILTAART